MLKFELQPKIVIPPNGRDSNLSRFQAYVEERTQLKFENYWELHKWSIDNFPDFWECVWHFFKIVHSEPYTEIYDKNQGFLDMQWFKGAKLNYAENIFKHRDSRTALISTNEENKSDPELISYEGMYTEVAKYAYAMKAAGVKKNDVIACCMSNRKEAILAFLATASIGALWTGALPNLGANAIISRFKQTCPKMLFSVDRFMFDRNEIDMLTKLAEISKNLPSLQKVVITSSNHKKDISHVPRSCYLKDFLSHADGASEEIKFEQVTFDHPLLISYTSGTTGSPKALVHSTGSFFSSLKDFGLHANLGRDDAVLSVSPVGWISWNMLTNCLMLGMTVCLYEGQPYFLSPTYFWDLVENVRVSYIFLTPTAIEEMKRRDFMPRESHKLENLKFVCVGGSPVKPLVFDFLQQHMKPSVFFASCYGSSEWMGFCSGTDFRLPLRRGEIQCFSLGIDGKTVDREGNYVSGERANLVITKPSPSLPIGFYNDTGNVRFKESYLKRHPGNYDQKDECWVNPITNGFIILGRSDEILNPEGARYSASEIYSAVWSSAECSRVIEDCICVSQYNGKLDERAVLFLKMARGERLTHELERTLREVIAKELTPRHVPEVMLETPGIPYNFNTKKMEIIVKLIINKRPRPNQEASVANPETLDFYYDLPQLRDYVTEENQNA